MQAVSNDKKLSRLKTAVFYVLIGLLVAFPLFNNLNRLTIRLWDEARNACNALEMSQTGNLLVTTYDYVPDMWNTKPPFLAWTQVFFIKIIGAGELAIRLPSAIAAFLTCLALFILCVTYLENNILAIITVLVLITIEGYVNFHCTRTGDFDAMLTLFITASLISFFIFIEKKQIRFLYFFFIALALGVLTKSVQALLVLPAVGIYTILQKQTITLLKNKHFYFGLLIFFIPVVSFYLLREHYNPGYLTAVQENELGGRYLKTLENHEEDFWFYYNKITDSNMAGWCLFVPCGLLTGLFSINERIKKITVFSALFIVTYLLIISTGKTKLGWYVIPMFPFLAMLVALFLDFVYQSLENLNYFKSVFKYNVAPILFLFLMMITPYRKVIQKTYGARELPEHMEYFELSYFLKDAIKNNKDLNNYNILFSDDRVFPLNFYKKILESKKIHIFYKEYKNLEPGDQVAVSQPHIKEFIANNFDFEVLEKYNLVELIKIKEKKSL